MPDKYNKILRYSEREKSMRVSFVIYADLECLLEKMTTCHNNPEKSSTTKKNKLFTNCSFDTTKNKPNHY